MPAEDQEADKFAASVMKRLPEIADARDKEAVSEGAKAFYHQKWSLNDVVSFSMCLEEVNPDLDEEIALAKMSKIAAKYEC